MTKHLDGPPTIEILIVDRWEHRACRPTAANICRNAAKLERQGPTGGEP
jgi:hypothetical protein